MSGFLKLDKNHVEIRDFLRDAPSLHIYDACRAGFGITDLIIHNLDNGQTGFLEIKKPKGGLFQRSQIEFMAKFQGNVFFTHDKEVALKFALEPQNRGLSSSDKKKLQILLAEDKYRKTFTYQMILRALANEHS